MDSSRDTSRRAAQQHVAVVAAGPPRSARWAAPAAAAAALGSVIAVPLVLPLAVGLAALSLLMLGVHQQDLRAAWRYHLPEPGGPVRFLPPLRLPEPASEPTPEPDLVPDLRDQAPVVAQVHVPTQAVPGPTVPRPRAAPGPGRDGSLRVRVMSTRRSQRPPGSGFPT
ncbi:MAG: hypothetical protein JWN08_1119 [Frankiales bacterium]|nr:hypothetical protein [Frankiales bacterium]